MGDQPSKQNTPEEAEETDGSTAPTPEPQPPAAAEDMRRSDSFLWDWNTKSPPASRGSSLRAGSVFSPPKPAELDTSSSMKRSSSSMWLWMTSSPTGSTSGSRNPSMHGRTSFAEGNHPERRSRNPSLRGGSAFAPDQPPIDETRPSPTPMRRNLSFMWDWAKFRDSPPATPHASLHGGQAFATAGEAEKTQLAVEPPKALTRDRSIGERIRGPFQHLLRLATG